MSYNLMRAFLLCSILTVFLALNVAAQAPVASVGKSLKAGASTIPVAAQGSADGDNLANRGIPEQYIIGEGDMLQVTVWKEPEASLGSVVVRADGKITMPFIKEVVVAGLTPTQAEAMITAKMKPFINEPDVTIIVREVHSKKIYLVGALRRTGAVELRYPMTVLQAITEAGGLNDFAKRKNIYILRTENGIQHKLLFNYQEAIRGSHRDDGAILLDHPRAQNFWLSPNDMIVVPQ